LVVEKRFALNLNDLKESLSYASNIPFKMRAQGILYKQQLLGKNYRLGLVIVENISITASLHP